MKVSLASTMADETIAVVIGQHNYPRIGLGGLGTYGLGGLGA